MKRFLPLLLVLVLTLTSSPAAAQDPQPASEPDDGAVVCSPGAYLTPPDDCLPLGPSAYYTRLAQLGLTLPTRPLPYTRPDASLTLLPYFYFHLDNDTVPIVSAPGETSGAQAFMPGFVYVSYIDRVDTGHGIYYLLQSGGWIPGKGARVSEISNFQGILLRSTPRNAFAWAFEQIPVRSAPGYNTPETGEVIYPFEIIQVYSTYQADGVDWDMIGPDQWVEARKVAKVTPNTTPPEGVTNGRWIEVNLAEQTLAVYDNYEMVFATMIASGLEPFWTRPGLFQIFQKKEAETMRNNDPTDFYYLDNVPYTMYFDGARALHGAYWRTRFGYPQSHGCINLSVGDSHWLFNWAVEGDWVYVHDPSGQTPTDPALYTGGAY